MGRTAKSARRRRPAWYHEDNRFKTRGRMDRVHAPIVRLAVEALAGRGGDVLDLGCGNGALLAKICAKSRGVVPHGVDVVPTSVAHARRLHPRWAPNFAVADIFRLPRRFAARRYALVCLAPRRLHQAGPEKARRLRAWLKSRCDRLLVYGYGTSLTECGTFPAFAAAVGIRVADPARARSAGLARGYGLGVAARGRRLGSVSARR